MQHRQVADRHPAVGEHHRQIGQHPTRSMRRTPLPTAADRGVKRLPATATAAATSASSRDPTWEETPRPSVVTVTFGYDAIRCT